MINVQHQTQQRRAGSDRQRGFMSLDYAIVGTTVFVIALAIALAATAPSLLIQLGR